MVLRYNQVPFLPLPRTAVDSVEPNEMVLRIQPDEGIELWFAVKVPGSPFRVRTQKLDFSYSAAFSERPPEAYERVLFDALVGDPTLFIREDEVEQAWRVVQPLIDAFREGRIPLSFYRAGTWGPPEADALLAASCESSTTCRRRSPSWSRARRPARSPCRVVTRRGCATSSSRLLTSTGGRSMCSSATSVGFR